jgi:hypothetical protein
MKRHKACCLCLLVLFAVATAGCSESQPEIHKGVLEKVDRTRYSNDWVVLQFKHGLEVDVHALGATKFYIGHYQEVSTDASGRFLSNRCDSYDEMDKDSEEYVPSFETPEEVSE